jgi:hypothetical protein
MWMIEAADERSELVAWRRLRDLTGDLFALTERREL